MPASRPLTLLFAAAAALACADSLKPRRAAMIAIVPDTTCMLTRDSVQLVAVAHDDQGRVIGDGIRWSVLNRTNARLDSVTGFLRASSLFETVNVMATADTVAATGVVIIEDRATSIRSDVGPRQVSVGTVLFAASSSHDASGTAVTGGICRVLTSRPDVAAWNGWGAATGEWVPGSGGRRLEALAPGDAVLTFIGGGITFSQQISVRQPAIVRWDEYDRCGLTADGEAWCKGPDQVGQLGTLTSTMCSRDCWQIGSNTPVAVNTDERFRLISSGSSHTCGLTTPGGAVYCWGGNDLRQLAGVSDSSRCRNVYYEILPCSFTPLAVDRNLGQLLRFDSVRAEPISPPSYSAATCGHVVTRGAVGSAPGSVDEIWCWGGRYGAPPQQRPEFFQ